jgi:hypothetical protein
MTEINQTVPTQNLHLSLWQMEHKIKNLHANTTELHEKTAELPTKTTEFHDQITSSVPDLTELIEKEEDATVTVGNPNIKLDIIRIGDDNTGEIRFGKDNPDSMSEYGEAKTNNSVITKCYLEKFVKKSVKGDILLGNGIEAGGMGFSDFTMERNTYGTKIECNIRLASKSAQTNASANDYVTKSEVQSMIAAAIAQL